MGELERRLGGSSAVGPAARHLPSSCVDGREKAQSPHRPEGTFTPSPPRDGEAARHQSRSSQRATEVPQTHGVQPRSWTSPCLRVVERRTPILCPATPQGAQRENTLVLQRAPSWGPRLPWLRVSVSRDVVPKPSRTSREIHQP